MIVVLKSFFVVLLTGVTALLCMFFPNAALDPESGLIMELPEELPYHLSYEREVSEEEKHWLPADTQMLKRSYYPQRVRSQQEMVNKSLSATLILSGADQRSLHRPEVCLDGQGWSVVDSPVVTLTLGGKELKVKDLYLERTIAQEDKTLKKVQAHYVYWWVGSHVSTADTAQRALISARENIFYNRNTRWGYPSIMVYVDSDHGETRQEAQQRAYGFIKDYGPVFLKNY